MGKTLGEKMARRRAFVWLSLYADRSFVVGESVAMSEEESCRIEILWPLQYSGTMISVGHILIRAQRGRLVIDGDVFMLHKRHIEYPCERKLIGLNLELFRNSETVPVRLSCITEPSLRSMTYLRSFGISVGPQGCNRILNASLPVSVINFLSHDALIEHIELGVISCSQSINRP